MLNVCLMVVFVRAINLEFDDDGSLLGANRDAVTISIDNDVIPERQKKPAGLYHVDEDEDFSGDDKTEVRTGQMGHLLKCIQIL